MTLGGTVSFCTGVLSWPSLYKTRRFWANNAENTDASLTITDKTLSSTPTISVS